MGTCKNPKNNINKTKKKKQTKKTKKQNKKQKTKKQKKNKKKKKKEEEKNEDFMGWMVNNVQLTWKLAWMLRTYRIYNSIVGFSKYEFYNKLLGDITLLRTTIGVT